MTDTLNPLGILTMMIADEIAQTQLVKYRTLSQLPRGICHQTQIKWSAEISQPSISAKDVDEDAIANTTAEIEPATLNIGQTAFTHSFSVNLVDLEQAMNTAPSAVQNLFSAHLRRGLTKILREFNKAIFNGDGTKAKARVVGLERVIDNASAYAGVTATDWESYVKNVNFTGSIDTEFTTSMLREFDKEIMIRETDYDLIITSPDVALAYAALFDDKRQIFTNPGMPNAELALSMLSWNGRPILEDPHCTPNTMYFLDTKDITVHTYAIKESTSVENLVFKIKELTTQNMYADKYELGVIPQLQVFNRRSVNAIKFVPV
jgi:hypothetical protein